MKLSKNITKFVSYFVLGTYLFTLTTNVLHFHHQNYRFDDLLFSEKNKKESHLLHSGSQFYCPVQIAFNSVTNSLSSHSIAIEFFNPDWKYGDDEIYSESILSYNKISYSLRAPPSLF